MKRIAMSLLMMAGIVFTSAVARPAPRASADLCDSDALKTVANIVGIYYTGVPAGVVFCGGYGLGVTGDACDITQVDVNVNPQTGTHDYDFQMTDGGNFACNTQVRADYDPATKHAAETLSGKNGKVEAVWTCSDDPWVYLPGQAPSCTNTGTEEEPADQGLDPSHSSLPFSAQFLLDSDRHVLNAQLQNAIKEADAEAKATQTRINLTHVSTSAICVACAAAAGDAQPTSIPVLPDFAITRISGPQQLTQGLSSTYEVVLANLGAKPQTPVQIEIQVTGSLRYLQMVNTPAGFDCEGTGPIICTGPLGGYGDPPITTSADFQLQVLGVAGLGSISADANPSGVIQESDTSNNAMTLAVTVK